MKEVLIQFRIEKDLNSKFRKKLKSEGRTMNGILRVFIEKYIENKIKI